MQPEGTDRQQDKGENAFDPVRLVLALIGIFGALAVFAANMGG